MTSPRRASTLRVAGERFDGANFDELESIESMVERGTLTSEWGEILAI